MEIQCSTFETSGGTRRFFLHLSLWFEMSEEKPQTEWLNNADFCGRMAERSKNVAVQVRWLTLAQKWLILYEPETETERFDAAVHKKGTGQGSSGSSN